MNTDDLTTLPIETVIEKFYALSADEQNLLIADFLATPKGEAFAISVWKDRSVSLEIRVGVRFFADPNFRADVTAVVHSQLTSEA